MKYFIPKNADLANQREHISPSGQFKLVITPYTTEKGSWNYTQGLVYKTGDSIPFAEVQRNYSCFPFCFIEDHPKGNFLICGEDYQGQTVIDLNAGKRKDFLPDQAKLGAGFCWSSYEYYPDQKTLLVDGCIWACPYEYRFYDFSDPMSGWPQIGEDLYIDADWTKPSFEIDGTIKVYQTDMEDDMDEDSPNDYKPVGIVAWTKYKREGLNLIEVEAYVSDDEEEKRRKNKEASEKRDAWMKNFKATDPLYLAMLDGLKDPLFIAEKYIWTGITHKGWCPDFDKQETRMIRCIHKHEDDKGYTAALEWGIETGPIKLILSKDGKTLETKFWHQHSVKSIEEVFAYTKKLIKS